MAQPFSFVFGGPMSGAIMDSFAGTGGLHDWQWMFLLEAVPAVIMGFVVLAYLDNNIDAAKWLSPEEKQLLKDHIAKEAATKGDHKLGKLLATPSIWLFTAILFCIVTGVYGINFWLPTMISETGMKSVLATGLVTAACYFSAAVMSVLLTRRAERANEKRWHATCAAIAGGAALALSTLWPHSTLITGVLLTLATTGALVASALFWSFPGSLLTGAGVAAGLATINSFGNLGGFVGPYLLGLLTSLLGSRTAGVGVLGAFMGMAGLLIAVGCRRYGLRSGTR
jgi:MFS family permease